MKVKTCFIFVFSFFLESAAFPSSLKREEETTTSLDPSIPCPEGRFKYPTRKCPTTHYKCTSTGKCVHFDRACNSYACGRNSSEIPSFCLDPKRSCPVDRFKCNNTGTCLEIEYTCDADDDCGDNSDESPRVCQDPARKCPDNYYKCNSTGKCLDLDEGCDSNVCGANSSELPSFCLDPFLGCGIHKFRCSSGSCIDLDDACNQDPDCPDRLDEDAGVCSDPQRKCPSDWFKCNSGRCIPQSYVCDYEVDCRPDGADENYTFCLNNPSRSCSAGRFKCKNIGQCIDVIYTCDADNDCGDNSDESPTVCQDPKRACPEDYYKCKSTGRCVDFDDACNLNACGDNSDENPLFCRDPDRSCPRDRFKCNNTGTCINFLDKCNAHDDCGDNSDESPILCQGPVPPSGQLKIKKSNTLVLSLSVSLTLAACIIIPLAVGFYIMWRRRVRAAEFFRNLTPEEIQEFLEGRQAKGDSRNGVEAAMSLPYDSKFEILPEDLDLDTKSLLGEGNFGCVYKGVWKGTQVAVKSTKPSADVTAFKDLLSELKTMAYIGEHQNVIKLLGCQTTDIAERIVRVVVELSPHGDLKSYLKMNRNFYLNVLTEIATEITPLYENAPIKMSTADFLYWSFQIADGMNYLASKKVVHADLAARNILLFQNNLVKISDFGLARQLSNYEKYTKKSQTALPWRWLSLESLRFMEFTSQSDVWSFGVLLWEIFTVGEVPFLSLQWDLEFVQSLIQGFRLPKPELASQEIYERMLDCWDPDPQQRITFAKLTEFFKNLLRIECPELANETVYIDYEAIKTE